MRSGDVATLLLLLLCVPLLAPFAAAAAPVEGRLVFLEDAVVEGRLDVEAREGALDLSQDVAAGVLSGVSWSGAWGYRVQKVLNRTTTAVEAQFGEAKSNHSLLYGEGSLRALRCHQDCRLLAFVAPGDEGTLGLSGEAGGALAWLPEDRRFHAMHRDARNNSFRFDVAAGALQAKGLGAVAEDALALADARASVSGRVGLMLWNVSGEVVSGNVTRAFRTGEVVHPQHGPAGIPLGYDLVDRSFIVLVLEGARLEESGPSRGILLASRPALSLDGTLRTARAEGWLAVDGERRELRGEAVEIEGRLALSPATEEEGIAEVVTLERRLEGSFSGRATRVQAGSYRVESAPDGAGLARAAAGLTLAGLLLAALRLLHAPFLAPMYTRLRASMLLANANRRRILAAVQAEPGLTVTGLVERTGRAEVVVRHHLRMLERHGLIATRLDGRARRSYALDTRLDRDAITRRLLLNDATRRRLAEALLPGRVTQRLLVERTGVSQRLVSYHLRRLESAGLLVRHEGKPAEYEATPSLREALPSSGPGGAA